MNNSLFSTSGQKPFLRTLFICTLLLSNCKKESEQTVTPDIQADSSSVSSLIVNCKSSDASATGFAVIDIQQFFFAKKVVSSTYKGKIFSVKSTNESDFKAAIDKVILDLQVPESYFKNYDSFVSIIEDRFKTKTGYQKAYDINRTQMDQLFNKQSVSFAFQRNSLKSAFFKNIFFASAGLGVLRFAPSAETFTLGRFIGLMTVGKRVSGTISTNQTIKNFFGAGSGRSTSYTIDDQIVYIPYFDGIPTTSTPFYDGNSYSYYYPSTLGVTQVFDAPDYYWNQFVKGISGGTGATFGYIPPNALTTAWATNKDRWEAMRLKVQQVTGVTLSTTYPPGSSNVTNAETAFILYSTFSQRYKDQTVTLWVSFDDKKREFYQMALYSSANSSPSILKFVNASVVNGNYMGDPAWSLFWSK